MKNKFLTLITLFVLLNAGKTNYLYSDNKLLPNTYIVFIKTPEGNIAQQVIVD